jgi:hypothetical protein
MPFLSIVIPKYFNFNGISRSVYTTTFTITKQNRHYCVNIRFLFAEFVKRYMFRPFCWVILRRMQYKLQLLSSVWIHIVSHIVRMLLLVLKFDSFKMQYTYSQYLLIISLKLKLNKWNNIYVKIVILFY